MVWMHRLFQSLLVCNHSRTPATEGKCYCPDCGAGVIFHWVVLRCTSCNVRRESMYLLREVVPADRCCTSCGEDAYRMDSLDSPAFYQLRKARLIAQTEEAYMQTRFDWLKPVSARTQETPFLHGLRDWCKPPPGRKPAYALAPAA